jgi:hypothetical protein
MPTSTSTDALLDRAIAGLHATNPQAAANLEFDLAQSETVAQTFTVTARGETITFTSTLSDEKVLQILRGLRSTFAADLAAKFNRLSEKQYAWAHKLAVDSVDREKESQQETNNEGAQFSRLFDVFKAAKARGLKRLTLRLSGVNVKPNRDLTMLWVTSQTEKEEGNYGLQPKYLGKVTPNRLDSRLSDEVKAVLIEAANDPLTAAIRYGKETGSCSCCGRDLTNAESIRLGIGPICREKFGL